MGKPSPIRLRTFLVPLAGVALYYSVQIIAFGPILLLFPNDDILSHIGLNSTLVALFMGLCLTLWLFFGRKTVFRTIHKDSLTIKHSLTIIPIALSMLGLASLYMIGISFLATFAPQIDALMKNYSEMTSIVSASKIDTIMYYIAISILIPVVEEIVFRGIILGEFLSTMRAPAAVILSSIVFGSMHIQPIQIGYAFMCGLVLGSVYLFSNSIYLSTLIHCIFNVIGGVLTDIFADNKPFLLALFVIEILFITLGVLSFLYLKKGYRNKYLREG